MKGLTPEEYKLMLLSVGTHRDDRPYSPLEVAEKFKKALDSGATKKECAQAVHLDGTTMVSRFLDLLLLHDNVKMFVDWGETGSTVAFTAAGMIAKLDREEHEKVFIVTIKNKIKVSEIKNLVHFRLEVKKPIEECIADVIRLRPRKIVTTMYFGAILTQEAKRYFSGLTQLQRDELLKRAIASCYPGMTSYSARLGVDKFLISGDENVSKVLNQPGDDFEQSINKALLIEGGLS